MKRYPKNMPRWQVLPALILLGICGAALAARGDLSLALKSSLAVEWRPALVTGMLSVLAAGLAQSLAAFFPFRGEGLLAFSTRWAGRLLALFPVSCLLWSFLAFWIGKYGYPIWSLMPALDDPAMLSRAERAARWLWTWTPAIVLTALPLLGAAMNVRAARDTSSLFSARLLLLISAVVLMVPVEHILGLGGSGARLAQAFTSHEPATQARALWQMTAAALLPTLFLPLPRWRPTFPSSTGVILSTFISTLLKLAALSFVWTSGWPFFPALDAAVMFDDPLLPLLAGLKIQLCALFLWTLGHIIALPRASSLTARP